MPFLSIKTLKKLQSKSKPDFDNSGLHYNFGQAWAGLGPDVKKILSPKFSNKLLNL